MLDNTSAVSKYVLEGRLVTLGTQGVLPKGAIYIDTGEIKAVQSAEQPPPVGFEFAPHIRTGDTIYPELIELHNHLSYNAMPLWNVPRQYTNSGQWKTHDDYQRLITKPSQILGRTAGVVEALVRFVECRCLLGGTTTSQGITLANAAGIRAYYQGIVRNVEAPLDPRLQSAGTRIGNPKTGEASDYWERLKDHSCYLQHLSEGIDATARGWFLRLQMPNGSWALNHAFCGIHSTALTTEDFQQISQHKGSVVWSPLSNYLLYGDTLNLRAVKDSQILMGIGCDWAPSGSKNLLGELKIAWLASEAQGSIYTPAEIVAMSTINAAKILKWDKLLGSIEPGKSADLIAINGQQGDDFMRLIKARETSLTLVIIDGVPRVGQRRLMQPFGVWTEEIRVGRSTRLLNLAQESTHPLVLELTLTQATERLKEAMQNLPILAKDIDRTTRNGLFSGTEDADGTVWRVVSDIEEEGTDLRVLDIQSLAPYVQPMDLEEITVVDDSTFLKKLAVALNLPEFIKQGLLDLL